MDYLGALAKLLKLVDHERVTYPSDGRVRYDLSRMEALLAGLNNPHLALPTVHIAGTKGKGSTAAMCASVLTQAGYRTGLFTSPHLHTFCERIRLDGQPVDELVFANLVAKVWPAIESVDLKQGLGTATMFEALTAMAFCCFKDSADFQVIEVGLGGRLDTTNLVDPRVCAITSLSLDHTSVLGDTISLIATEKAGIIKPGATVVTAPQVPEAMKVIESRCQDQGGKLIKVGEDLTWSVGCVEKGGQSFEVHGRLGSYDLWTPLLGDYQLENATTAVGVLEALVETGTPISTTDLTEGFKQVEWPCRMEVLQRLPTVVCDGAHNPHSAARLRDSLSKYFDYDRILLVAGISHDKNLAGIVIELAGLFDSKSPEDQVQVIATRSRHPKAAPSQAVAEAFRSYNLNVVQVESVNDAIGMALEDVGSATLVLATGSLFVASEVREAVKGITPELYPELQKDGDPSHR